MSNQPSKTSAEKEREIEKKGMFAAAFITASPHEWKWNQDEQEAMAGCCVILGAKMRIAIEALQEIAKCKETIRGKGIVFAVSTRDSREARMATSALKQLFGFPSDQ